MKVTLLRNTPHCPEGQEGETLEVPDALARKLELLRVAILLDPPPKPKAKPKAKKIEAVPDAPPIAKAEESQSNEES